MLIADRSHEARSIQDATIAYSARRVDPNAMRCLVTDMKPRAGDLVLAMVTEIGHHKRLHLAEGGKKTLFVGDLVIVAYADRYAPNQFEAFVPGDLGECHLVAAGGIAGRVVAKHARISRNPTRLRPLGLIASEVEAPPLNLGGFALPPVETAPRVDVPVIAVVGTSMDAGKTTCAAHLVHGLRRFGARVGYAKVTGTGAAGDPELLRDAGASPVLDFTDVGFASTYRLGASVVESIFVELISHLKAADVEAIVLEIADGLLQKETADLLESNVFRKQVDSVVFAAGEALSALAGAEWLRARNLPLRAVGGCITRAPLQVREAKACHVPILGLAELGDPATAAKLLQSRND
jgi:dethiobiotin synthetase